MVIIVLCAFVIYSHASSAFGVDPLVKALEREQGLRPGRTMVIPECSCTVKYLGTRIEGHTYMIYLAKLD
jgi:hypothetical protein